MIRPHLILMMLSISAFASTVSRSREVVLIVPHELPEIAQPAGQSMELHSIANGSTYLYIEQQQLGRLAILDVSDPGHIKQVGIARLDISQPFDFAKPIGGSAFLVCYRNDKGAAILDVRHPKEPTLVSASGLRQAEFAESIGDTVVLMMNVPRSKLRREPFDYQVVDSSDPLSPQLLGTVHSVEQRVSDPQTGAIFLLGSEGLTVIQRPKLQEQLAIPATEGEP